MIASTAGALFCGLTAHATSLQIQPTIYKNVVLKKGEKAKAFVDISNPTAIKQEVKLTVQRYRQIDDDGTLTFFDDEAVSKGIKLDLDNFELNPRDSIRVFFQLDGSMLPSGDVFAAIFARTVPIAGTVAQAVQVGTLLSVTNGTPTSHSAEITSLTAPFFQWGESIHASIVVKNSAPESSATGFFPDLTINVQPYETRTVEGPLVFAGRSRSVDYTQKGSYAGFVRLNVTTEGGQASRWVFVVTGFWRLLLPLLIIAMLIIGLIVRKLSRR